MLFPLGLLLGRSCSNALGPLSLGMVSISWSWNIYHTYFQTQNDWVTGNSMYEHIPKWITYSSVIFLFHLPPKSSTALPDLGSTCLSCITHSAPHSLHHLTHRGAQCSSMKGCLISTHSCLCTERLTCTPQYVTLRQKNVIHQMVMELQLQGIQTSESHFFIEKCKMGYVAMSLKCIDYFFNTGLI